MSTPVTAEVVTFPEVTDTPDLMILPEATLLPELTLRFSDVITDIPNDPPDQSLVWEPSFRSECKALQGIIPTEHVIRDGRNFQCPHCGTLLFRGELSDTREGRFSTCCRNGNIQLPRLPVVPEELLTIFRQPTYRVMSRKVNHSPVG